MSPQVWPSPFVPLSPARRWFAAGELVIINPYWNIALSGGDQHIPVLSSFPPMRATPVIRRSDGTTGLHIFRYRQIAAGSSIDRNVTLTAVSPSSVTALYSDGSNGGSQLPAGWMLGTNLNPIWLDAT